MPSKTRAEQAADGDGLLVRCPHCRAVLGRERAGVLTFRASVTTAEMAAGLVVDLTFKRPLTFTCWCKHELTWAAGRGPAASE